MPSELVCNATGYGVHQNWPRWFLLGHLAAHAPGGLTTPPGAPRAALAAFLDPLPGPSRARGPALLGIA